MAMTTEERLDKIEQTQQEMMARFKSIEEAQNSFFEKIPTMFEFYAWLQKRKEEVQNMEDTGNKDAS